jgi:D-serine deaminase-like pyridoxal phosphate-dependent protein
MEWNKTEDGITEITVGSGFYAPALFDYYNNFKHLPAAGFALAIVRQPKENMYTCLGGGYIASGSVGIDKQPKAYLPEGINITENEGFGEVQTPFTYSGAQPLQIGDAVFFRHSKAGELCERFNELYLIKDGKIMEKTPTYRGMGQCFL